MMGFVSDWQPSPKPEVPCRNCGVAGHIEFCKWESPCGGYEDIKYRCTACEYEWWIEGTDS